MSLSGVEDDYAKIDYSSKLRANNLAPRINEGTSVRRQETAEFEELEQFVKEEEKKPNFESTNRCTKVSTIKWGLLILFILLTCTLAILVSLLYLWVLELKQEINVQKEQIQYINSTINSLSNNGSTVVNDGLPQSEQQERTTNDTKVMMEAATDINQLKENASILMDMINSQKKTISEKEAVIASRDFEINRLKNKINELAPKQTLVMVLGDWHFYGKNWITIYNSMEKSWKYCKLTLPSTLEYHGAVLLNNEIYIFDGYGNGIQGSLNSLYKLGAGNKWERIADMAEKRGLISQSSVVFNSEIWVIGGHNRTNTLKSVEKYNPKAKKWTKMPELNEARTRAAATVIDEKIYVSGGWDGEKTKNSVEVYDPEKEKWEIFTPRMPYAVHSHILIGNHSHLIAIGGDLSKQESTNQVWKIDVSDPQREWKEMPSLQQKRYEFGAAIIADELMVFGGSSNNNMQINPVEIFDGVKWKKETLLPEKYGAFASIPLTCAQERLFLKRFCPKFLVISE